MVRRIACCAPSVIESASSKMITLCLPGGNVTCQWRHGQLLRPVTVGIGMGWHLLLRERLDAPAHHLDTTVIRRIQLQHALLERVAQQRTRQREHARGFPGARWA